MAVTSTGILGFKWAPLGWTFGNVQQKQGSESTRLDVGQKAPRSNHVVPRLFAEEAKDWPNTRYAAGAMVLMAFPALAILTWLSGCESEDNEPDCPEGKDAKECTRVVYSGPDATAHCETYTCCIASGETPTNECYPEPYEPPRKDW